jgi:hypothetical protein
MLGHHNINPDVAWGVNRVRTTFADDIGNAPIIGTGTGFWMFTAEGRLLFVTNRHNVDPGLRFPHKAALKLADVEIELRVNPIETLDGSTRFFKCSNVAACLFTSKDADVAAFVVPTFADHEPSKYPPRVYVKEAVLADQSWFQTTQGLMDECYFIGYPGVTASLSKTGKNVYFYDTQTNVPVARQAIIASPPPTCYRHPDIKTSDVILVSGMSFSGSSGSPVITPELGLRPGGDVSGPYRPVKVIGIMSGSFGTTEVGTDFTHAGLSYLTMSTAILRVIEEARSANWSK